MIKHEHVITFNGRPSLLDLTRALNEVEKLYNPYTKVAITTNGSSDPDLEEVYMMLEVEK